jgi:unsaturated chondroitin disaccharide hydrolase
MRIKVAAMRICVCIALSLLLTNGSLLAAGELDSLVQCAIAFSTDRVSATDRALGDSAQFPRYTRETGVWKTAGSADWTSGFYPGCLWYTYELTGDTAYLSAARRWTEKLDAQKFNTRTHDVGFIINSSFGNGYRLSRTEEYRDVLITAAGSLATRYSSVVRSIRSWDNRKWAFPVIIDNMMNLELLFRAADLGGAPRLREIAVNHAVTTMTNHFRNDGSTYHVISYDSTTGVVLVKETHQGYANESVWARGQAWAIYGFTMAYRETRDERFLATAIMAARYFIDHLPSDAVPYWDFAAPGIPHEPRDASAAAIACSGLMELSTYAHDASMKTSCSDAAKRILRSLCMPPYLAEGSNSMGILNHAVGNMPARSEVDVSLIYGDYYFLESLVRYKEWMQR